MKKLEVTFHKQDDGDYCLGITTEGHVSLADHTYVHSSGNRVSIDMFDWTA